MNPVKSTHKQEDDLKYYMMALLAATAVAPSS